MSARSERSRAGLISSPDMSWGPMYSPTLSTALHPESTAKRRRREGFMVT